MTTLGTYIVAQCPNLTSISIPASVTSIGNGFARNCTSLITITVDSNNQNYKSENGMLLNKAGTNVIQGVNSSNLVVPNGVTSINTAAFYGLENLTSLTLPSTLTTINASAIR